MTVFEEIRAKLETIQSNIDELEARKKDDEATLESELQSVRDRFKEDSARADKAIAGYKLEQSSINYTFEMLTKMAAEYEQAAENKLVNDSEAAGDLYDGGATPEKWVTFYQDTKLIPPDGFYMPEEIEPETDQEEQQEEEPAQAKTA